ncbi:hypothetical protein EDEG_03567 [Edhazardia aedis USNM 41457]|uniref:Uncharacterized protein n=1 Tax=Edhazardia aedis (strain USNM 41457) TaxID=1003232 RepID=J8ZQI4_EDHAE|nr:hypothetical protein EDEG_03567 [Edhazardia aedis USNM 41457]|eukprot:EJW01968.1 hypothetical protein EDEG_03567 [Edhazardia aedis USNM 41457]
MNKKTPLPLHTFNLIFLYQKQQKDGEKCANVDIMTIFQVKFNFLKELKTVFLVFKSKILLYLNWLSQTKQIFFKSKIILSLFVIKFHIDSLCLQKLLQSNYI